MKIEATVVVGVVMTAVVAVTFECVVTGAAPPKI